MVGLLFSLLLTFMVIQFFQPFDEIISIIFLIFEIFIIALLWFITTKKQDSRECKNSVCNKTVIEMMRKCRHDILNNMQVISCYVGLKRTDEIINYLDTINYFEKQRSLVTSFSSDKIAAYLYKIHVLFPDIVIRLEIEENINLIQGRFNDEFFLDILDKIVDTLYQVVDKNREQHLIISFGNDEMYLIINIDFDGNVSNVYNKISKIEKDIIKRKGKFILGLNNDKKFIVDLHFPLKEA
ncbi:MAG: Spo0B domain-containing protein [Vulcanibacillus sp.]